MSRVHIVGAGLAGLAAAVRLAGQNRAVSVYEASGHAGGRCRSFCDSKLDCVIDNGNHLLLSGNVSAHAYLEEIGAVDTLTGPEDAVFPFVDLQNGRRWTVRLNAGPMPWWVFVSGRRPPGTRAADFLAILRLARAGPDATLRDLFEPTSALFVRFLEPLAVAALNTPVGDAAAAPLWTVFRETFARGGVACRPLITRDGLSESFVAPALRFLSNRGAEIHFNRRLKGLLAQDGRVTRLEFGANAVHLAREDRVILALPPANLGAVLPDIPVPQGSHAIVNGHFKLSEPPRTSAVSPVLGVLGGVAEWLFLRGAVVSVTVSAADALAVRPADEIGARLWQDVARALTLDGPVPPFRIVKERRATFAQTPSAMHRRPPTETHLANLVLAGDWTATGLPATIESAIRSGHKAAAAVSAT